MAKLKKFYITTAIAYVNADPHIGHALELIQTDFIARWHRQLGEQVYFLTGTDEHGVKIVQTAKAHRLTAKQLADKNAKRFQALTKALNISNDNFIRTSDQKLHWPGAQKLWKLLSKDVYKKEYTGKYCSGCEKFVIERDLTNGRCQYHPNRKIEVISEENYFFSLSKYTDRVTNLVKTDKYAVLPKSAKSETLEILKNIKDVSFSRTKENLPWGVPVPGDKDQVMYVWCDALSNYLTGIGFGRNTAWKKYWPADVHVIGKDITRFHSIYWPAMLLSAKIPLPKKLAVHGFITHDKQKMSKSLGNVVDPFKEVERYGADAVRYFILREIPSDGDGDYSQKAIVSRINNELVNELGNLVSRSLTLIEKNGGKIPAGRPDRYFTILPNRLLKFANDRVNDFELHLAINSIWSFISDSNNYIQKKQPWTKPKDLNNILYNLANNLRITSALIQPFLPETADKIAKQLGLKTTPTFADLKKPIKSGLKVRKGSHLFKRV